MLQMCSLTSYSCPTYSTKVTAEATIAYLSTQKHYCGTQKMQEERRRLPRQIGGVYQLGQVITSGGVLSTYTAYNRNTNDVVGLLVIEYSPTIDDQTLAQLMQPLE